MTIRVVCPKCSTTGSAPDHAAGKKVRCSNSACKHVFDAPMTPSGTGATAPVHSSTGRSAPQPSGPSSSGNNESWRAQEREVAQKVKSLTPMALEVCGLYVGRSLTEPDFPHDPMRDLLGLWGIVARRHGVDTQNRDEVRQMSFFKEAPVVAEIAISILQIVSERASKEPGFDKPALLAWLKGLGLLQ